MTLDICLNNLILDEERSTSFTFENYLYFKIFITMKTYSILWNRITFEFNRPDKEWPFKNKEFEYSTQIFYWTFWINKLLKYSNDIQNKIIMENILKLLAYQSYEQKLNIFQKLTINHMPVLCVNDWTYIRLITEDEYSIQPVSLLPKDKSLYRPYIFTF